MSVDPRAFVVRGGVTGDDGHLSTQNSMSIVGWEDVPSLEAAASFGAVKALVVAAYPGESKRRHGNYAGQLHRFVNEIQEGDFILLPRMFGHQIVVGRVVGLYRYSVINGVYRHTRAVEWAHPSVQIEAFRDDIRSVFSSHLTVFSVTREDVGRRVAAIYQGDPDPGSFDPLTREEAAVEEAVADMDSQIERTKNLVAESGLAGNASVELGQLLLKARRDHLKLSLRVVRLERTLRKAGVIPEASEQDG